MTATALNPLDLKIADVPAAEPNRRLLTPDEKETVRHLYYTHKWSRHLLCRVCWGFVDAWTWKYLDLILAGEV